MFNPKVDLAHAETIPSYYYYDPNIFKKERQIFKHTWQYVGGLHQLHIPCKKPSDVHGCNFVTKILDEPILVVQNGFEDINIEAFANVCRHRGTILHTGGFCKKFTCPYHGWTYSLKGELTGCTEFAGVENFKKEDNGLHKFQTEVHEPFIFVNIDGTSHTLNTLKYCFPKEAKDYKWHSQRVYDIRCNWKVYVDNYLDGGYHVNHAHPSLAEAIEYSQYKTEILDSIVIQSTPLVSNNSKASKVREGTAHYIWMFPNFMINASLGTMDTNYVIPVDENNCKVVFDFYFSDEFHKNNSASIELSDKIQQEDVEICERVQEGMKSDTYQSGRYCVKREGGVYHFHRLIDSYM